MAEETERAGASDKRRWVGWLQLGAVLGLTALALYFMRPTQMADIQVRAQQASAPLQVDVVQPSVTQRTLTVDLTGVVSLHGRVGLQPRVPGRAIWVSPKLRNGGTFAAEETLLKVDPEDYELAVQRGEARVEKKRARMRKHSLKGELAGAEYERTHPGQPVPPIVLREPQMARFQAATEQAQAELAMARLALARTDFSLPFAGRVLLSQVEVGSTVGPGDAFGAAYRLAALEVDAAVALDDLAQLDPAVGRAAEVHIGARSLPATVERVSAGVDPRSRMASLYLKFAEGVAAADLPLPGIFVEVSVAGRTVDDVFALPDEAERPDGGVWVVEDGVLRAASPQSFGRDRSGWIVAAFDAADGIVVGPVPAGAAGLEVEPTVVGSVP